MTDTPTTDQPALAVTQADREAAEAAIDAEFCGALSASDGMVQAFARHRTHSEPRPAGDLREARACHFAGIEYSHADLTIAQRAACAIVPLYGTGDHGEQEAARAGKIWNDHPAVQGALRALHEARMASPAALEAIDRFVTDHVGNDDTGEGIEVDERAQAAVAILRIAIATHSPAPMAGPAIPENLVEEMRKLYRGLEMSAGIMRDSSRTGGWSGAERTANAFARYAATAQSLHALLTAAAHPSTQEGGNDA